MSQDIVVGIDSSTTATKAIAWDGEGAALAEGRSAIALATPQSNYFEQDPLDWWRSCCTALRQLSGQIDPQRIAALAISNQRETFAPLDEHFNALRPGIVWLDERCRETVASLVQRVGAERLHEVSGKPPDLTPVVYRLAWMAAHEPELLRRTRTFADVHAYLTYQLSGERATSWASADPFGCFDMQQKNWSAELLEPIGVSVEQLPPAQPPGSVLGRVSAAAAAETGLVAGIPVVAGGGDGQCAGVGCAVLSAESAYLNLGTAVVSGVYGERYLADRAFRTMISCSEQGYIYESVLRTGTFLVNWLIEQLFGVDPATDPEVFQRLEAEAARVPAGCDGLLLVPYWSGVMTPYWQYDARGSIVGLSASHGRAHLYRAMMEGIALEQAMMTDRIEAVTGVRIESYLAIGGGAASDLWCQIVADASGRSVQRLTTVEASNLGAAMAAAVGAKWYGDFASAALAMRGKVTKTFAPDPVGVERYAKLADVYRGVHPRLSDLFAPLTEAIR